MATQHGRLDTATLEPAKKIVWAALQGWSRPSQSKHAGVTRAFVTVSRQPGAGAGHFSHRLAERLNATSGGAWSAWDQELVEKVSAEEGVAKQIVEMIENRPHTWLEEMLESFANSEDSQRGAELHVYKRVAMTIRALAQQGHAILVGQGGRFITARMDGGIHVRLVAPLEHRIKATAERHKLSTGEAGARVEEMDRNRDRFFQRYWPGKSLGPDHFFLTLNAGELSVDEMVECVLPLVRGREAI